MYVYQADDCVFNMNPVISTNSQLNVVCGGLWQSCAEPRRAVKFTAGVGGTTPLTVPEGVIRIECRIRVTWSKIGCIAKVILTNKWNLVRPILVDIDARAIIARIIVGIIFIQCRSK